MTTVSTRKGLPLRYSTETWDLPSGRRKSHFLVLADFGEALRQAMLQAESAWHKLFGFIAGVTEHQAWSPAPPVSTPMAMSGDWRLIVHMTAQVGGIETKESVVVADLLDSLANQIVVVDDGRRGDFTGNDDQARRDQSFAGDRPWGPAA